MCFIFACFLLLFFVRVFPFFFLLLGWGAHKSLVSRTRTLLGVLGQATLKFVVVATLLFFVFFECPRFCLLAKLRRKVFGGSLRSEETIFRFIFPAVPVSSWFFFSLLRSRATPQKLCLDANEEEGGDDENGVDEVDSDGASDVSEVLGPVKGDQQGHFMKPAWAAILPQPPEDMAMHNLKKLNLCIALDYGREVGWEIGRFSNFYHTSTHKGEYVLNFEGVLGYQACLPWRNMGKRGNGCCCKALSLADKTHKSWKLLDTHVLAISCICM